MRDEILNIVQSVLIPQETKEEKRLRKLEETYRYVKERDSFDSRDSKPEKVKSFVEPPKKLNNLSLW